MRGNSFDYVEAWDHILHVLCFAIGLYAAVQRSFECREQCAWESSAKEDANAKHMKTGRLLQYLQDTSPPQRGRLASASLPERLVPEYPSFP